jgi:hypothetical protein
VKSNAHNVIDVRLFNPNRTRAASGSTTASTPLLYFLNQNPEQLLLTFQFSFEKGCGANSTPRVVPLPRGGRRRQQRASTKLQFKRKVISSDAAPDIMV